MPFAVTWMDLETVVLSEVSQRERDKQDIAYMWSLKSGTNELIHKTVTEVENKLMVTREEKGEEG